MSHMHCLIRKGRGWVHYQDVRSTQPYQYVVPVGKGFYRVQILDKRTGSSVASTLRPIGAGRYQLDHPQLRLTFRARGACLPYVGKLSHPDFRYLLREIQVEDVKLYQRLHDQTGLIVFGVGVRQYR